MNNASKAAWHGRNAVSHKMLSVEQSRNFDRLGYHFPLRAFAPGQIALCRSKLESFEQAHGGTLSGQLRNKPHLLFTWADEIIRHPAILDAVEDLLGPDLLVWSSSFFTKDPKDPGFVSWHQDSTYWGLEPDDVVTAWVALTEVTPENGCMQVIPGSHRIDQLPHLDTFHKDNLLSRGQEIAVDVDKSKAVSLAMRAGEMSLHHIKLVHGSDPNRSDDRRIGFAIRYIPTYVRQTKVRDSATLVRGVDTVGAFDHEPRPRRDLDDAALAAHADAIDRQVRALYQGTEKTAFRA